MRVIFLNPLFVATFKESFVNRDHPGDRAPIGRRTLLVGLVGAGLATFGRSAIGAKRRTRPDARCPGPPNVASFPASSNYRFGQTYTARKTGKVVRADVLVNKNMAEDADWIVQIVAADVEGRPSEKVLAEARIANGTLADGDGPVTLKAEFSPPASVVVNQEYAVVLAWGGDEPFDFPNLTENPCGGRLYVQDQDQANPYNVTSTPRDLVYTTYVKA